MGKISIVLLSISLLTLIGQINPVSNLNLYFSIVAFVISIYGIFLDLYIFLTNPYSLKTKVLNLIFETIFQSYYEEKRKEWSFKGLNIYCNQFFGDECYHAKSQYLALFRDYNYSDDRIFKNEKLIQRGMYLREHSFNVSVRNGAEWTNETSWENITGEDDINQTMPSIKVFKETNPNLHLFRSYNINGLCVSITVKVNENDSSVLTVVNNEIGKILYKSNKNLSEHVMIFRVFSIWEWILNNPKCGVISTNIGGEHKGVNYLHCLSIDEFMEKISLGWVIGMVQHESSSFCVAGGKELSLMNQNSFVPSSSFKEMREVVDSQSKLSLRRGFFETDYCYEKVSGYIKDRFKNNYEKVIDEFIRNTNYFKFDKKILGNWQSKRLFSDISLIQSCIPGIKSRVMSCNLAPTRSCYKILNLIKNDNLPPLLETNYKIDNLIIEDLKLPKATNNIFLKNKHSIIKSSKLNSYCSVKAENDRKNLINNCKRRKIKYNLFINNPKSKEYKNKLENPIIDKKIKSCNFYLDKLKTIPFKEDFKEKVSFKENSEVKSKSKENLTSLRKTELRFFISEKYRESMFKVHKIDSDIENLKNDLDSWSKVKKGSIVQKKENTQFLLELRNMYSCLENENNDFENDVKSVYKEFISPVLSSIFDNKRKSKSLLRNNDEESSLIFKKNDKNKGNNKKIKKALIIESKPIKPVKNKSLKMVWDIFTNLSIGTRKHLPENVFNKEFLNKEEEMESLKFSSYKYILSNEIDKVISNSYKIDEIEDLKIPSLNIEKIKEGIKNVKCIENYLIKSKEKESRELLKKMEIDKSKILEKRLEKRFSKRISKNKNFESINIKKEEEEENESNYFFHYRYF